MKSISIKPLVLALMNERTKSGGYYTRKARAFEYTFDNETTGETELSCRNNITPSITSYDGPVEPQKFLFSIE